ncbi:MAG: type III-A CRISPR-associated protein Cas10/Csm1 [Marinifilaceae bacterium]|nr:type III-A CRISPR-associated protein Cas10/Csm1 [Marinifilaceae bacterium]
MDSIREHIYLAALLHDIGKFYQRADTGQVKDSLFLNQYCKDESTFCPLGSDGKYAHKHVLWTAQFIDDFSEVFKRLLSNFDSNFEKSDSLISIAAGHHLKADRLSECAKIIKEADSLSFGMDSSGDEALKDSLDETESSWESFNKKRLIPILQTISLDKNRNQEQWLHIPVGKLKLDRSTFPKDNYDSAPDYKSLWRDFVSEFKLIHAETYRSFSETFFNLLYKYCSTIPASTINFPDVSLYDHLKTTAAIAVCLYDYQQESNNKSKNPFLLIGADFSGIQTYIYQIVSKYAGKNLKGRSFYLRLLSDAIVRYLLKELDLYQANVIYNSGGGFYILAPNTLNVRTKLHKAIQEIEHRLFETHGTLLYVALDWIEMSRESLMHADGDSIGKVWGELFARRNKKKATKFSTLIQTKYASFFEPIMYGGDAKCDSITGEELLSDEEALHVGDLILKKITAEQITLGKKLRETNLIIVKYGDPIEYLEKYTHIAPLSLGFTYYILNRSEFENIKDRMKTSAEGVTILTLNGKKGDSDFIHSINGGNIVYSLEFYGGNELVDKSIPTFEEMCENSEFSRMGVLRMDVDNLGLIFQQGIPAERATLSRYSALSRSFDYFFSGYINTIWQEIAPRQTFIVYSGGDDLFIVGSWDKTIELAERIKDDFAAFACYNPAFSLSGGVAILSPSYPIMKGAEESAEEESKAKGHQCNGYKKSAISFMKMALNWDFEFNAVKHLKSNMVSLLKTKIMPKSFISKLLKHYANAEIKEHKITNYKTYWMLTYDLSRMKSRYDKQKSINILIDNCLNEICNNTQTRLNGEKILSDYHPIELWAFAARWAELEYRTGKKQI